MRPRKTDRDLPPCVYRKHGAYWYVKAGKWTRLGDTLPLALSAYARARAANEIKTKAPEKMPALLHRWLEDVKGDVAPVTLKTYGVLVRQLSESFAEFRPDQVTARDVVAYMHHRRKSPGMANHARTVLINALDYAFREQTVERNVARDVRPMKTEARDRLITDGEFDAIKSKATPTLAAIMDVLYYTGQRIGDVLAIKYSDLGDDGIAFKQHKTGTRLVVAWSDELRAAVANARALHSCLRGLTLFHTRRGTPFTYSTIRTLWDRATADAGIDDVHIHDIRAKAGTEADAAGLDSKRLLGHKSESSHKRYLRSREVPIATPPSRKKSA